MVTIINGEVVDTQGGDCTWLDVWGVYVDGNWKFYELYYGSKGSQTVEVTDPEKIKEYLEEVKDFDHGTNKR